VVPANTDLGATNLFQHFHHLLLVDGVNRFNADGGRDSRHREDVFDLYLEIVDEFSNHDAHHFKRNTSLAVLDHF